MDLIRTVSRDISPDSSKDCRDCTTDAWQEKEYQTDETIAQNVDKTLQTDENDYLAKIELQQSKIDQLRNELEQTVQFHPKSNSKIYIHQFEIFSSVEVKL